MKAYNRIFAAVIALFAIFFVFANRIVINGGKGDGSRPYQVEINRIAKHIAQYGFDDLALEEYTYVTNVERYGGNSDFYEAGSDYAIREIDGSLYRFDYSGQHKTEKGLVAAVNIMLAILLFFVTALLLFVRHEILSPFRRLGDVPYELSKGNLTVPLKEREGRFFGRFVWGMDLLRERLESQKQQELKLQKEKKLLLLSLSHDLKTPLSAIKLYSKALSKGLYTDEGKKLEIAENINAKADEIENFVSQIILTSKEDFLDFSVNNGEFYLSELVGAIRSYYDEKLSLLKTDFLVGKYTDCLLKGDIDRSVEVLQNIVENSIKYGDGKNIKISFSGEEDCILVSVENGGCTLSYLEASHIFESFWRGSNSENVAGSGLGLYICRNLMLKMNGDIFADIRDGLITVTLVFNKA